MPKSQPSSGNGGSCDLGGAGGDGSSGGGETAAVAAATAARQRFVRSGGDPASVLRGD
jgi:hypothetical protein